MRRPLSIVTLTLGACVVGDPVPAPLPPPGPPPAATWWGADAHRALGVTVHASAVPFGPVVLGTNPTDEVLSQGPGRAWRVSAATPSGVVTDVADGWFEAALGYGVGSAGFLGDPDGDGDEDLGFSGFYLLDAAAAGATKARDAWLQVQDPIGPFRVAGDCGDVSNDGIADLCFAVSGGTGLTVWRGPIPPGERRPPVSSLRVESTVAVHEASGLQLADGRGALALVTNTMDDEPYRVWLLRDLESTRPLTSGDAWSSEEPHSLLGRGDLTTHPGEELVVGHSVTDTRVRVLAAGADGPLVETGFSVELTDSGSLGRDGYAAVGDLDGDGQADLALGFAAAREAGSRDRVFVFRGPLAQRAHSVAEADLYLEGVARDDFGTALAAADVDGDGRADLVVGAPGDDGAAEDGGAAYLFLGASLFP